MITLKLAGVDGGNRNVKVFGEAGPLMFPSLLGEWRERNLVSTFSEDDMEFEFRGKKGFAGTLAEYESEFATSQMGESKAHNQMLVRTLLGLHRYFKDDSIINCKIAVGQPISRHKKDNEQIKKILIGEHSIIVNEVEKTINILDTIVAVEGASAWWADPKPGKVRIIDVGGGTVNLATLVDGKYIDKGSDTIVMGMESTRSKDLESFAEYIADEAIKMKWAFSDQVIMVGGGSEKLADIIATRFLNPPIVLKPKFKENGNIKMYPTIYSNAIAFYLIARKVFGNDQEQ